MNPRIAGLLLCILVLSLPRGRTAEATPSKENEFFAMDTAASGNPESVVPILKELGYDGLGGSSSTAGAMAAALKTAGLKLFNVYLTVEWQSGQSALSPEIRRTIDTLQGHDSAVWLAIAKVERDGKALPRSSEEGDVIVGDHLREIAEYASPKGVKIALYPHTGCWLESVFDALQVADKLNRPDIGVTFNLCHWLKVNGDLEPQYVLKRAIPRLMFVTINGADSGKTKMMDWKRLIQPLGTGTYDLTFLLRVLRSSGYRGPIGLQGYGIKMEPRKLLKQSMDAWRELQAKVKAGEQTTTDEIAAILRVPDLSPSLSAEDLHSSFPPPDKTAEEIASTLSAEAALNISKARRTLGSKLPTVTKVTLYSLLPVAGRITDPKYSSRAEELERLHRFHKYPVLGEVTISDPDEANRWVDFLRDQIHPGGLYLCGFMPRHGFRLSSAKGEVDILMCYSCDQLAAFGAGEIDWKINPVFSSVTKDVVNQLFDKLKIERDKPEEKRVK